MGNGSALRRCGLAADLVAVYLVWDSIGGRPPPGAELQTISVSQLGGAAVLALLGMALRALANRARDRATSDPDPAPDTRWNPASLSPYSDLVGHPLDGHLPQTRLHSRSRTPRADCPANRGVRSTSGITTSCLRRPFRLVPNRSGEPRTTASMT